MSLPDSRSFGSTVIQAVVHHGRLDLNDGGGFEGTVIQVVVHHLEGSAGVV